MKRTLLLLALWMALPGAAAPAREVRVGDRVDFEAPLSATFTFPARLGQMLSIGVDGLTHAPVSQSNSRLMVYRPDGSKVRGIGCRAPGERSFTCKVVLPPLTASGRYSIEFHAPPGSSASGRLMVNEDVACALERGRDVRIELPRAGTVGRCTLQGLAKESIVVEVISIERDTRVDLPIEMGWAAQAEEFTAHRRFGAGEKPPVKLRPTQFTVTGTHTFYIDPGFAALPSIVLRAGS